MLAEKTSEFMQITRIVVEIFIWVIYRFVIIDQKLEMDAQNTTTAIFFPFIYTMFHVNWTFVF